MLIETMPDVLTWRAGSDVMLRVYRGYVDLLSDRLGALLCDLRATDPRLCDGLDEALRGASDLAFSRVLTAPETSYRLIWQRGNAAERGQFIFEALRAERAREGEPARFNAETWTALGDIRFFPDGLSFPQPRLPWEMPLDFASPYADAVDLGNGDPTAPRGTFTSAETERVLALLHEACDCIGRVSALILDFTVKFNKVLVLQKDLVEPGFTSGSTGQFVGRSFLVNPHLAAVHPVLIAEGIVHEAIHSLLYMQERQKSWVKSDDLYHPKQALVSPWSGSSLALRPFMQACFVWYGLLNFWCAALIAGVFDQQRVRARISVCLKGFLGRPLVGYLDPWREGISEDLIETIAVLQDNVTRAKAETG